MYKLKFFLIIAAICCFQEVSTAQFEVFKFAEQHTSHCIIQDTIWTVATTGLTQRQISTGKVLARYTSLNSDLPEYANFEEITIDRQKRIWAVSDKGIARIDKGKLSWFSYIDLSTLLGFDLSANSICTDSTGRIWLTNSWVPYYYTYDNNQWERFWLPPSGTSHLQVSPDGTVYSAGGNGLFVYKNGEWLLVSYWQYEDVVFESDSSFYVAGGDSVWHHKNGIKPAKAMPSPGGRIDAITLDKSNKIWVAGQFKGGVAWFDGQQWQSLNDSNNGKYTKISIDANGDVWATAMHVGTKRYANGKWKWFRDGFPMVSTAAANNDGSIWIGQGGLVQRFKPDSLNTHDYLIFEDSILLRNLLQLKSGYDNQFFAAFVPYSQGYPVYLSWIDSTWQMRTLNVPKQVQIPWERYDRKAMVVDKKSNVFSLYNGELSVYNTRTGYTKRNLIEGYNIKGLSVDGLDRLWAFDEKFLHLLRQTQFGWVSRSIPLSWIFRVEGGGPYCWIWHGNNQLFRYNGSELETFNTPFEGLTPFSIFLFEATPDGRLWMSVDVNELYCFDGIKWTKYSVQDGTLPFQIGGISSGGDQIWIWDFYRLARLKTVAGTLKGRVMANEHVDCALSPQSRGMGGIPVEIRGKQGNYTVVTDADGYFSVSVDTGQYSLNAAPIRSVWSGCFTQAISVKANQETAVVLFLQQQGTPAAKMQIETVIDRLRSCAESRYIIQVCNDGTATADEAAVKVVFPTGITLMGANVPYVFENDSTAVFSVGNMKSGQCERIDCVIKTGCDPTLTGRTLCLKAHVSPDTLLTSGNGGWKSATMELSAHCETDSVVFVLANTGLAANAQPLPYEVLKDDFLYERGRISLNAGKSRRFAFPRDTSVWRFSVPQEPGHPSAPAPSLSSNCQTLLGASAVDRANSADNQTGSPFDEIECKMVINSFDPNDKQAVPRGIGTAGYIEPRKRLFYTIRFQNTGTDTAFKVVIRDTLHRHLNWSSLKPGLSSHPYRLEKDSLKRALAFIFDPIALPDSNANEPASHGFVQLSIDLSEKTPLKSQITNKAAIYFDFNAPIVTNEVIHTVDTGFLKVFPRPIPPGTAIRMRCTPNPGIDNTWLHIDPYDATLEHTVYMTDVSGKLYFSGRLDHLPFKLDVTHFPAGLYFVHVKAGRRLLGSVKLAVIKYD